MKKSLTIIFSILLLLIIWIFWYLYLNKESKSIGENNILNWILEKNEDSEKQEKEKLTKEEAKEKINNIKKKIALKWLITKWDLAAKEQNYISALIKYKKVLKDLPFDRELNEKIWDIYVNLKDYKNAFKYYKKILNFTNFDNNKALISFLNSKDISTKNVDVILKEIDNFKISKEEKFYYKNSVICINNFEKCISNFETYFQNLKKANQKIKNEHLKSIKTAEENFKNFKSKDNYYKKSFLAWAYFENNFYLIAIEIAKQVLEEKKDYKPMMKLIAKSAYEIWNYNIAKIYLKELKKLDYNDSEITYFLARVYEKLNDKTLAIITYKKSIKDWYKNINDIRRRLIFIFYDLWEMEKVVEEFNQIIDSKSKNITLTDYNLAIYYNIVKWDLKTAKKYSEEAIKKYPNSEVFYWYLSWIILQKEKISKIEYEYVRKNINKAMSLNSENSMILMVKWIYEAKMKNNIGSIMYFKKAKEMDKSGEFEKIINSWIEKVEMEKWDLEENE